MRNFRHSFALLALAPLVACGDDGGKKMLIDAPAVVVDAAPDAYEAPDAPPDAPPRVYDFSCEGVALPTTASDSIALSGTASTINVQTMSPEPLPGVLIESFKNLPVQPPTPDETDTSAANGNFALAAHANPTTMPYDVYLKATKTGIRTNYIYPPSPFLATQGMIPSLMFSNGTFDLLVNILLSDSQMPGNGVMAVAVTDCANAAVGGVTLSVKQNGAEVGKQHDLGAAAGQAEGVWFVLDVPPGDTDISATYMGHTWRVHPVRSFAGATTTTIAVP